MPTSRPSRTEDVPADRSAAGRDRWSFLLRLGVPAFGTSVALTAPVCRPSRPPSRVRW